MEKIYLVTGATGFLGHAVIKALTQKGEKAVGLKLPGDSSAPPSGAEYETGDITKPDTLTNFFDRARGKYAVLIHCAGLITIASQSNQAMRTVNVDGTRNIVELSVHRGIDRLIYVSSVHAIREEKKGTVIKETTEFSARMVEGDYAKSKAEATAYVLHAAKHALDAVVVHPSGIIGPGDRSGGYLTEMVRAFLKGRFLLAVKGGYDFVDVRDVAQGVIQCAQRGRRGEGYILSNQYITIQELFELLSWIQGRKKSYMVAPLRLLAPFAPLIEKVEKGLGLPLLITPYSVYTLGSNGRFSHQKADMELGYAPRRLEETLRDMVRWMEETSG